MMQPRACHPWDLAPGEAIALQKSLAGELIFTPISRPVGTIAGVDISVKGNHAHAAVVVLSYPSLEETERRTAITEVTYPYVPGLLTFREAPAALHALAALSTWPDLIIFDGQGYAHPRRLGLASHLGLILNTPAIGCAKSRLCGTCEPPDLERGSWSPLIDDEQIIGAVVRTRTAVSPVYVSAGHLTDLQQAIQFVLNTCRGYRLPEPTRQAHRLSTQWPETK